MNLFGKFSGSRGGTSLAGLAMAVALALSPSAAVAAPAAPVLATEQGADPQIDEAAAEAATAAVAATQPAVGGEAAVTAAAGSYTPMTPTEGKGMPSPGGLTFQDQYSKDGEYALWMHDAILLPVITVISLFVLFLMLWTITRYRRKRNPVPSRTTHNTLIEVVWTVVPAFILLLIAVPSITLLAKQYKTPPKDAITVKAVGVQWHWEYEYPDHGVSFLSKMLNEPGMPIVNPGVRQVGSEPWDGPAQLEVDNRLVVPVGVPLRMQVTANDVIHAFAIPSLWFKIDAVPGRLNERLLTIEKPGVYYGQCSELCGVRHGYMPIAIEAVPMERFNAWIVAQGGTIPGSEPAAAAPAPVAPATGGPARAPAAGEVPATEAPSA